MTTSERWQPDVPPVIPSAATGPRGVIGDLWHGGPFSSPGAIAVTILMCISIFAGMWWMLSRGDKAQSDALAKLPSAQSRMDDYQFRIDALGLSPLVETYEISGTAMTIAVAQAWHYQPHPVRLQAAQKLWQVWADVNVPLAPEDAPINITDTSGNEVGGFSAWSGVWVVE